MSIQSNNRWRFESFDQFSTEYEKRFLTSLTLGSAAGFLAIMSFVGQGEDAQRMLNTLLPSLWALFLSIVFSGASIQIVSVFYRHRSDHYGFLSNKDEIAKFIQHLADKGITNSDLPAVNQYVDRFQKEVDIQVAAAEKSKRKYILWHRIRCATLSIATLSFGFSILWPLFLLTKNGYL